MTTQTARRTLSKRLWRCLAAAAVLLPVTAACTTPGDSVDTPPESKYTQAEAYAPMEAAAADAVEALPDFPGFEQRSWNELVCSHNGKDDPDYTNIEIDYRFSLEDSESEMAREQYIDELRDHWTALGYEITRDDVNDSGTPVYRNLVAEREDGISVWYRVAGYVGLLVQSGCVPVSDQSEIEYVAPAGGIEPGGEGDKVSRYFPDGVPTDQAAAINPFANAQAVLAQVPFDAPASYDDQL